MSDNYELTSVEDNIGKVVELGAEDMHGGKDGNGGGKGTGKDNIKINIRPSKNPGFL
tara:strand:- start:2876 stop:3046 length:171 start_codon:yes stop_codon:yes gene_type:complete